MHEPRDLKRDSLTNWQPVQLPQHWCDVVMTTGARDQASGSILHRLVVSDATSSLLALRIRAHYLLRMPTVA